ncbi:MAG TPA: hypothetical protein VGF04_10080 [Solirubrobacterales bacterium]|jgi:hypothetical protein
MRRIHRHRHNHREKAPRILISQEEIQADLMYPATPRSKRGVLAGRARRA